MIGSDARTHDPRVSAQHLPWPRIAHLRATYRCTTEPLVRLLSDIGGDGLGPWARRELSTLGVEAAVRAALAPICRPP